MNELAVGVIFLVVLFFIGLIGMIFCNHEFWHGVFWLFLVIGLVGIVIFMVRYNILKEIKIWQLLNK